MWNLLRYKRREDTSEEKKLRSINFWYVLLLSFIILWVAGAYVYLYKKTDDALLTSPPIVLVEGLGGISPDEFTNFFTMNSSNMNSLLPELSSKPPLFEAKEVYEIGEIVVVRYFYVEAVIIDRSYPGGNSYTILYKDHDHALRTINLPKNLLMSPKNGVLNPFSLLID